MSRRRQELPWVRVDKNYRFETDEGTASLTDLFRGRSQLLVYHFADGLEFPAAVVQAVTVRGRTGVRLRGESTGCGPRVSVAWIPQSPGGMA